MKRYIIILISLIVVVSVHGQQIKTVDGKFRLNYEELGEITLSEEIKLKDLYRVDKSFDILKSLGTPLDVSYKNEIAYEMWNYKYYNLDIQFINQNGYIEIMGITIYPSKSSRIKFGKASLNSKFKIGSIISEKSIQKNLNDKRELPIGIYSNEGESYKRVKFYIFLEEESNKMGGIVIVFNTT